MEDTLVTVAIHTYEKAQVLRSILEIHGIEVFMQEVNPLLPAMSLGIQVRIRQSDLDKALAIIENMKDEEALKKAVNDKDMLLLPVDFSEYSIKLCEFGFDLAKLLDLKIVLLHTYSVEKTVMATLTDAYTTKKDEANRREAEEESAMKMNLLKKTLEEKIVAGTLPRIEYRSVIREGIPEETILEFSEMMKPYAIVMGTRGTSQKDLDIIGSVTAEVMERATVPVFTVPEKHHFLDLEDVKNIACSTNFGDGDLTIYNKLLKVISKIAPSDLTIHFIHHDEEEDRWADIKLRGMKDYFLSYYPNLKIESHLLKGNDILTAYDEFVRTNSIDVLSLITHRRNLLRRMFKPSMARKIVFHTNTPMMVFHE